MVRRYRVKALRYRDDVYLAITILINGLAMYFALFIAPAEVEMASSSASSTSTSRPLWYAI